MNAAVSPGRILPALLASPKALISATVALILILAAAFAPLIAPHDPFALGTFNLMDSELPPIWLEGGDPRFFLGTDTQGRDLFSAILYGMRVSLIVGFAAVAISAGIGTLLGLIAGLRGGWLDAVLMRFADVILSFPTILIALLVSGIARGILPDTSYGDYAIYVLILAIAINEWTQYARTVRGQTLVEAALDYVKAARIAGLGDTRILARHILPNILSPVIVIGTINLALAVLAEATLSFLGVGMPATQPSLGTLIRIGNENLFSGIWWVVVFPALTLVILVLSVNLFGDWLRDAFNPRLE